MKRRQFFGTLGAAGALGIGRAFAGDANLQSDAMTAWLYVLPLIEMAAARARMLQGRAGGQRPQINAFAHSRNLAGPQNRGITTPNTDTIYSSAFIDLTEGAVTLSVPDAGSRYLSVAVLDMYTDADIVLGPRSPGGAAGTYRLIGPKMPARDGHDLRVATPHAWVLARILVDGEADLPAARQVQDQLVLAGPQTPLPPAYATRASDWSAYFRSAQDLLDSDPPGSMAGYGAFERLRNACRSRDFARNGYSDADAQAIDAGVTQARTIVQSVRGRQSFVDGWSYPPPNLGNYGDDILYRAIISVSGLGALPRQEAMYMRAAGDHGDGLFYGDGLYRLPLSKAIPVDAFWSLTMYEATPDGQFFMTENALRRYAIGDRTPGLRRAENGMLDIWIGRKNPGGEKLANWLPAPATGPFALILRAYLPNGPLLDGTYRVPAVIPVKA